MAITQRIEKPPLWRERRVADRRLKNIGSMTEKRVCERRRIFRYKNEAFNLFKEMSGIFDEYISDHEYSFSVRLITRMDGTVKAPYKIFKDWLGYDFRKIDISKLYVNPGDRIRILDSVKVGEFSRVFPYIRKGDGSTIVLDVLIKAEIDSDEEKIYYCYIDIED